MQATETDNHSANDSGPPDIGTIEKGSDAEVSRIDEPEPCDVDDHGLFVLAPTDPRHPTNWPFKAKVTYTWLYGLITFSAQFASTVLASAIPQLGLEFHIGREVCILAYCIFLLGNMVGPMLFAPASELYGRRVAILIPNFVGGVCMLVCANSNSIEAVVVFRFFAGVFAASPLVNCGGAMADMWNPAQRMPALVLYALNIVIGASIGPVFGALLVSSGSYGWRWSCWLGGLLMMVISVALAFIMPETYPPVVEKTIARDLRIKEDKWETHSSLDSVTLSLHDIFMVHFARPIMLLSIPVLLAVQVYASLCYGLIFLLLENQSYLFITYHHFSPVASSLPALSFIVGFVIGGAVNIFGGLRYKKLAMKIKGRPPMEEFLFPMLYMAWTLPAGMFMYGWSMYPHVHWIVSCIGFVLFGAGFAIIFQGCIAYSINSFPKYAASVVAGNVILRSVLAGTFPLFASQMFEGLNPHWASSLLGFIAVALIPVPWLFYYHGARLRQIIPIKSLT